MGPKTNAVLVPGVRKVASSYADGVTSAGSGCSHHTRRRRGRGLHEVHPRFCPTGKQRVRLVKSGQPPMRDMEN